MSFITEEDRPLVLERLAEMADPVRIVVFTRESDCEYCDVALEIYAELASLTEKIALEVVDIERKPDIAAKYGIDKVPAAAAIGKIDYGIRWYGMPLGYEFVTVLDDIVAVSKGDSGLSDESRARLAEIVEPLHLQVFVTPTCPWCPRAVSLAHRFAIESPFVRADMVEATEFPDLAARYHVRGVPRTVVNEDTFIEGAMPENAMLDRVLAAVGKTSE